MGFLYLISLVALVVLEVDVAVQILLTVITAVVGFVGLSLGYYLGQKGAEQTPNTHVTRGDAE